MENHDDLAARLRAAATDPTDDQLDRVRGRVLTRDRGTSRRRSAVLVGLLTAGMLSTSAGATLAISGISSSRDASVAQYVQPSVVTPTTTTTPAGGELGETAEQGAADEVTPVTGDAGGDAPTLAAQGDAAPTAAAADAADVQQRQAGGELPFTGYAGMTAFLIGLALLGTGLALRRGTRRGGTLPS